MTRRKRRTSALAPAAVAALGLGLVASEDAAASSAEGLSVHPSVSEVGQTEEIDLRRRRDAWWRLSEHPSPEVRRQAIDGLATVGIDLHGDAEGHLVRLATDPAPVVRRTLAASFGRLLTRLPEMDGCYLLAAWATAKQPELRWAAACALCGPVAVPVTRSALAALSTDPDPLVRRVAEQAAQRRGQPCHHEPSTGRAAAGGRAEPSGCRLSSSGSAKLRPRSC